MVNDSYKAKAKALVERAREKGTIKTYEQFCETELSKTSRLSEDEVKYYTFNRKKKNSERFSI